MSNSCGQPTWNYFDMPIELRLFAIINLQHFSVLHFQTDHAAHNLLLMSIWPSEFSWATSFWRKSPTLLYFLCIKSFCSKLKKHELDPSLLPWIGRYAIRVPLLCSSCGSFHCPGSECINYEVILQNNRQNTCCATSTKYLPGL